MKESICLILHRKSANEEAVKDAVKTVLKEGADMRVLVPWNKQEKIRIVNEMVKRGVKRIIAGGGDGTINGVVNALMPLREKGYDIELGVMPLGTANDFARGVGLPLDNLTECLRIACHGQTHITDVGKMNKEYFINVASLGFGAEITATTPVQLKKALGGAAYTLMGMVKALGLTPYKGRLIVPGEDPADGEMLFMAVGNNRLAGGGFEVAKHAKLNDGLLDLALIRPLRGFTPGQLSREMEDPMAEDNQVVSYRQLADFTIESDIKLHCNLDGEPVSKKRLKFSVVRDALKVIY